MRHAAVCEDGRRRSARRSPRDAQRRGRDPAGRVDVAGTNAGALAFKRSGDPNMGNFNDATILKSFGDVPTNLDEL